MNVHQLLARLERVRPTGPCKWRADCLIEHSSRQTVAIAEAPNGMVKIFCHACGSGDELLAALGLSWRDLFPDNARELTQPERSQWRETQRAAGWAAALRVLTFEGAICIAAAGETIAGRALSELDMARLRLALKRLTSARQMLAVPSHEDRRHKGAAEQAQADAEQYRKDIAEVTRVRA